MKTTFKRISSCICTLICTTHVLFHIGSRKQNNVSVYGRFVWICLRAHLRRKYGSPEGLNDSFIQTLCHQKHQSFARSVPYNRSVCLKLNYLWVIRDIVPPIGRPISILITVSDISASSGMELYVELYLAITSAIDSLMIILHHNVWKKCTLDTLRVVGWHSFLQYGATCISSVDLRPSCWIAIIVYPTRHYIPVPHILYPVGNVSS